MKNVPAKQLAERHRTLDVAIQAAKLAGELLARSFRTDGQVVSANGKDLKTTADIRAQEVIFETLKATRVPILSEEDESSKSVSVDARKWIIDPLDGTYNFTRGFAIHCVSISLWEGLEPELGVVYDFHNNTLYIGTVRQGATCNGVPIRVSDCTNAGDAVLATGFPADRNYSTDSLQDFVSTIQRFKKIRMIGSAAMSLAHLASGIFDVYAEDEIWIWDVAAGLALVKAAGGAYTLTTPDQDWKTNVVAHNGKLGN